MNICFVTSGHLPFDDRIYYHQGKTLSDAGHRVGIISSKAELKDHSGDISLDCFSGDALSKRSKIKRFVECLEAFSPDIIICSEPLPVVAAKNYSISRPGKARIIYDITEWYPSGKNLAQVFQGLRPLIFLKLLTFNIFASRYADAFIFGEYYKSKPYRFLFPGKPYTYTTYYPDLKYINYTAPGLTGGTLRLCYTGRISREKGFGNFIKVLKGLTAELPDLKVEVRVIGWYERLSDRKYGEVLLKSVKDRVAVTFSDRLPFHAFCESLNNTDIFIDLRSDTFENRHSLPIKLFYYAAYGRPVIFSDLKAIRLETDTSDFGFLVKPDKSGQIVQIITSYIQDGQLYYNHCRNARKASEDLYNWGKISTAFLSFIDSCLPLKNADKEYRTDDNH